MIFALSNAVQARLTKDQKQAKRAKHLATEQERSESSYQTLMAQTQALEHEPVHDFEAWLESDAADNEPARKVRISSHKSEGTVIERDIYYVHIRKEEARNILYFAWGPGGFTLAMQLGSYKFTQGRQSLLEIFHVAMRRLGYTDETMQRYYEHSPVSAFTTTGSASQRAWMNAMIRNYNWHLELPPAGQALLEHSNALNHANSDYLHFKDSSYSREKHAIFADYYTRVTDAPPTLAIPGAIITVRLTDMMPHIPDPTPVELPDAPWRRFSIPQSTTCRDLSALIMGAFGLANYHWTEYYLVPPTQQPTINIREEQAFEDEYGYDDPGKFSEPLNQTFTPVSTLFEHQPATIYWNYDFGDNFWYTLEIEPITLSRYSAEFLAGAHDPVPTDVGSYDGWERFTNALADLESPEQDPESIEQVAWAIFHVYWRPYDADELRAYFAQSELLADPASSLVWEFRKREVQADALAQALQLPEIVAEDPDEDEEQAHSFPDSMISSLSDNMAYLSDENLSLMQKSFNDSFPAVSFLMTDVINEIQNHPDRPHNRRISNTLRALLNLYGAISPDELIEVWTAVFPDERQLTSLEIQRIINLEQQNRPAFAAWVPGHAVFFNAFPGVGDNAGQVIIETLLHQRELFPLYLPTLSEITDHSNSLVPQEATGPAASFQTIIRDAARRSGQDADEILKSLHFACTMQFADEIFVSLIAALNLRDILTTSEIARLREVWIPWQRSIRRWMLCGHTYDEAIRIADPKAASLHPFHLLDLD